MPHFHRASGFCATKWGCGALSLGVMLLYRKMALKENGALARKTAHFHGLWRAYEKIHRTFAMTAHGVAIKVRRTRLGVQRYVTPHFQSVGAAHLFHF